MEFLDNLRSLQDDYCTCWEQIFGDFWGFAEHNIFWSKTHKRWDGQAFNMLFFSVAYILSDDKVKHDMNHYISMVNKLGRGSLFKEME